MLTFAQLLSMAPSGLYQLNGNWRSRALDKLCHLKGVRLFRIDGGDVHDKRRFLVRGAQAMGFPDGFGVNWDAFADRVTDLGWAPAGAYVVILGEMQDFAAQAPQAFRTALSILEEGARFWSERAVPFHVLVADEATAPAGALPVVRVP